MGPPDTWQKMADWLRSFPGTLAARPGALLVVSAHWEAPAPTVTASARPPLIYDYSGFPAHTYELEWPAPGAPELATPPHQDAHYMKVEGPVWIAWVPLDECPVERGSQAAMARDCASLPGHE